MTFNSKVPAQEGWYISPGVQIGIDSKGNLHRSAQVTLGLLIEPFTTGLTIGYKWFRKFDKSGKKSWNRYNYYDLQSHALESIIQPGIGFGLIQGDNIKPPRLEVLGIYNSASVSQSLYTCTYLTGLHVARCGVVHAGRGAVFSPVAPGW